MINISTVLKLIAFRAEHRANKPSTFLTPPVCASFIKIRTDEWVKSGPNQDQVAIGLPWMITQDKVVSVN